MTHRWRTTWLVVTSAILFGLGALAGLAGTADDTASTGGRVISGVIGVLLAVSFVRMFRAGLTIDGTGVHVYGIWRTRHVAADQVGGLVMESSPGGRWLIPSAVTTDGRFMPARWAGRPGRRPRAAETAGEIGWALQPLGADSSRLAEVLSSHGVEVRGAAAIVQEYRSPPTWPEPPRGWRPVSGWRPAPDWAAAPADWQFWQPAEVPIVTERDIAPDRVPMPDGAKPHLDPRYPLDREVAATLPGTNWGLGEVVKTLAWLAVLLALTGLLYNVTNGTVADSLGEATLGLAVLLGARKAARQSGGWRRALGWSLPRRSDAGLAIRWLGWTALFELAAALLLLLITLPLPGRNESNVDISPNDSILRLIVLAVVAIVLAPLVEEFLFRGLLLRALMRRFSYWPAAIVNALIFGIAHAPQVDTWQGRVRIAGQIAIFGLMQCQLVRRTGRLGPAMLVHGLFNGAAVGISLS